MSTRTARWLAIICLLPLTAGVLTPKEPPRNPRFLPGKEKGEERSKWIGPYVQATWWTVGNQSETTVTWLSPDGKVLRRHTGKKVDPNLGYICDYEHSPNTIYGINDDWQLKLTRRLGRTGFHTATPDSRVYVFQHYEITKDNLTSVDIYVKGKLANSIGTYPQYLGNSVHLANDGSLAFLTWKDEKKSTPQVIVAGADGKVTIRLDVEDPIMLAYGNPVAPGGRGVLLQANRGGESPLIFQYYTANGKVRAHKLMYNPQVLMWLPDKATSLFSTAVGSRYRFQLFDWDTGKALWDIGDPLLRRTGSLYPEAVAAGNFLIFCGREDPGDGRGPVRSLCAVDIATGNVLARWQSDPLRPEDTREWLLRLGNKLYLMTDHAFSEIDAADIVQRKNGWK
jgi:hypothetical protein